MDVTNSPSASREERENDERLLQRLTAYSLTGLFALALLAALQVAGEIVVPIFSALVVGSLLGKVIDRLARLGLKPALAGFCVVAVAIALGLLLVNALIEPFSSLISQAPEMINAILQMVSRLLSPLADLRNAIVHSPRTEGAALSLGNETTWLTAFLGRLTPAIGELLVFFASLAFFVAGRAALRKKLILAMPARESRPKTIRAYSAVENALVLYFGATALVYAGVGAATALVAFICGLSNPLLWGAVTFIAAYIPYFGVALITISLAASGLLTLPHSAAALAPALSYLAIHVATEMAVIPTLLGRHHEINPFVIFISIVFWSWMWGPVGALLAVPLLVTAQSLIGVIMADENHLP